MYQGEMISKFEKMYKIIFSMGQNKLSEIIQKELSRSVSDGSKDFGIVTIENQNILDDINLVAPWNQEIMISYPL